MIAARSLRGDVELHFHCQVKEQEDKPKKSQQHPVGPYDKEYQVDSFTAVGASLEAIYPVWQEDLRISSRAARQPKRRWKRPPAGDTATLAALDAELSSPSGETRLHRHWPRPPLRP